MSIEHAECIDEVKIQVHGCNGHPHPYGRAVQIHGRAVQIHGRAVQIHGRTVHVQWSSNQVS